MSPFEYIFIYIFHLLFIMRHYSDYEFENDFLIRFKFGFEYP